DEPERSAERLGTVLEAGEPGSAAGIGAADSVIANAQSEYRTGDFGSDPSGGSLCVFGRVGQYFSDHIESCGFKRRGDCLVDPHIEVDWYRRPATQRTKRRCQPTRGKKCGIDTTADLADVIYDSDQLVGRRDHLGTKSIEVRRCLGSHSKPQNQ